VYENRPYEKQPVSSVQTSPAGASVDAAIDSDDVARPSRIRLIAIVLWALQIVTIVLMVSFAIWDVESIVGTAPALTIIGLLLAIVAGPLRSWTALSFGISGPLICIACARTIAHFNLSPPKASEPIPIIAGLLALLTLPLAVLALTQILSSDAAHPFRISIARNYSLKSLLVITTVFCFEIGALRAILVNAGAKGNEYYGFDLFNLTATTFILGAVYLFVRQWRRGSE
jgi:hypothetical protein